MHNAIIRVTLNAHPCGKQPYPWPRRGIANKYPAFIPCAKSLGTKGDAREEERAAHNQDKRSQSRSAIIGE